MKGLLVLELTILPFYWVLVHNKLFISVSWIDGLIGCAHFKGHLLYIDVAESQYILWYRLQIKLTVNWNFCGGNVIILCTSRLISMNEWISLWMIKTINYIFSHI
jgi:hypothetical protein